MSQLWAFFWSLVNYEVPSLQWHAASSDHESHHQVSSDHWSHLVTFSVPGHRLKWIHHLCQWALWKQKLRWVRVLCCPRTDPILFCLLGFIYFIQLVVPISWKVSRLRQYKMKVLKWLFFIYFPSLWFSSNGALITAFIFNEDSPTPSVVWRHALAFPGVYLCVCVLTNAEFSCSVAAHISHQYCPKWKKFKKLFWSYGMT